MPVHVKICGITNTRDAHFALEYGADALGFVFYSKSPRAVSPEMARDIIGSLPPFVTTVGLFVNETIDRVREIKKISGVDLLQLHGDETPEAANALGPNVIKVIRVQGADSFADIDRYTPRAFLLDAHHDTLFGGTGQRFDWDLAQWVDDYPVIVAGGLNPDNVARAVERTGAYGVDVSSGVEKEPGIKDPAKLKAFITNAKAAG
ncbi:MAG: phosphoribosylanthranilate isomerase [Nitrospirota bacterium]|nr:phosphoribosylanthranilate isomerase [Nitrospirota bacterium]